MNKLLGSIGDNIHIDIDFHCKYDINIHCGSDVIINMNCTFIDNNRINIANNVLIALDAQIHTTTHTTDVIGHTPPRRQENFRLFLPHLLTTGHNRG